MTKKRSPNEKYNQILGMDTSTASMRLARKIVYHYKKQKTGEILCYRCGQSIDNWKVVSYDHKIPWRSGKTEAERRRLFLDTNNIALAHTWCNFADAKARKGEMGIKFGYVGIYFTTIKTFQYYASTIKINGKSKYIGFFQNVHAAAISYDIGVYKIRNGKSCVNFDELRPYYQEILKKYEGRDEQTFFYRRGGSIIEIIKKTLQDNRDYFVSKNLNPDKLVQLI